MLVNRVYTMKTNTKSVLDAIATTSLDALVETIDTMIETIRYDMHQLVCASQADSFSIELVLMQMDLTVRTLESRKRKILRLSLDVATPSSCDSADKSRARNRSITGIG